MAEGKSDEERAAYVQQFSGALTITEGQKPLDKDPERRRRVIGLVVKEVKGLGTGSEKGASAIPRLPPHDLMMLCS